MNKADLQLIFNYHYWAHRRVWDCVMKLTDEQFEQDLNYSIGSIRNHCIHTMVCEWMWFSLARDAQAPPQDRFPDYEQFMTRESIRNWWDDLEAETRAYLSEVEDAHLDAMLEYEFSFSGVQRHPRWQALMYIVTHAIDHRAQILAGIHRLGGETVIQDFIRFVWDQNA
jgi:uncharacterized damage-inducible protein DinB